MKAQLCRCNNCDTVMIDENPSDQPILEVIPKVTKMEIFKDEVGSFWGCPSCNTDEYIVDVTDINQLEKP